MIARRIALVAVVVLAAVPACTSKDETEPPSNNATKPTHRATKSTLDVEVERALVLQSAVDRADREQALLEASQPRDEAAIGAKKKALLALNMTLAEAQRRIELLTAMADPPKSEDGGLDGRRK